PLLLRRVSRIDSRAGPRPLEARSLAAAPLSRGTARLIRGRTSAGAAAGDAAVGGTPEVALPESEAGLADDPPPAPAPKKTRVQKAQEFANRVFFGLLLGLAGAVVILYGKLAMLALLVFVSYQASQEYFGFMTSKQMSKGMPPPPPLVSAATTVMCMGVTIFSHFNHGRSGTLLAVASFLLLVTQVVVNKRPKFAQLASSVFGLFYCGWLPSFWLKLRGLSMLAPDTPLAVRQRGRGAGAFARWGDREQGVAAES
ncbi:hypothetical protein TSOC_007928, partial [Tetrabaena socialis]